MSIVRTCPGNHGRWVFVTATAAASFDAEHAECVEPGRLSRRFPPKSRRTR